MRQQIWGEVVDFILAFFSLSENVTVKTLLKSVHIYQSYCKKNLAQFFWPTLYNISKAFDKVNAKVNLTLSNALEISRAQMLTVLPLLTISSTTPRTVRIAKLQLTPFLNRSEYWTYWRTIECNNNSLLRHWRLQYSTYTNLRETERQKET